MFANSPRLNTVRKSSVVTMHESCAMVDDIESTSSCFRQPFRSAGVVQPARAVVSHLMMRHRLGAVKESGLAVVDGVTDPLGEVDAVAQALLPVLDVVTARARR